MKIEHLLLYFCCAFLLAQCNTADDDSNTTTNLYFPPLSGDVWETQTPASLQWQTQHLNELFSFLETNNTRAFIVLKNGKIVLENYWGNTITNDAPFDKDKNWYWASAGKGLTAVLTGIAQEENLLSLEDPTHQYLGTSWTSLSPELEQNIKIKHQLQMTTGLHGNLSNLDCTAPSCLQFAELAGSSWYYHNAPYTLLEQVVSQASGMTFNQFTQNKIKQKTGMDGTWLSIGENNVYWSTARSAARFGLLMLNRGQWDNTVVLGDQQYFNAMINTSQTHNLSYGYLWWLNGKSSIMYPGINATFNTNLAPNAPDDLYVAMGKNGQFIGIVPSQNLVYVRFGESPDDALVPVTFHNDLWQRMSALMNL